MKRLMRLGQVVAAAALLGCRGDATLGPVQTIDGQWAGTQNGVALSINVVQNGTDVAGAAALGSIGGSASGTVAGTFAYPNVKLTLSFDGYLPVDYTGTMSTTEAKIIGKINGSGFANIEVDLKKK